MSAGGVAAARSAILRAGGGATPTPALQPPYRPKAIMVKPIPHAIARQVCEGRHYLGSFPGAAVFSLGVFVGSLLLGVAVLGLGNMNLPRLFRGARHPEVLALARLWLDDRLGRNCESRVLGIVVRTLRRHQTTVKALAAYSDPAAGHRGVIYQAAGFLFLGESEAMPKYRLPNGDIYHSRSLSHRFGTHSRQHFAGHGVRVDLVPQAPKLVYVALIDPPWRDRLTRPVLPYPRKEGAHGGR